MTRTEAIDLIKSTATRLDDERVQVLLNVARKLADAPTNEPTIKPLRALTARERAAVERSKEDFAEGRVLDQLQYEEEMAVFMAGLKAESQSSP